MPVGEPPPGSVFAIGSLRPYADLMQMMQELILDTAATEKERTTLSQALETVMAALLCLSFAEVNGTAGLALIGAISNG